MTTISGKKKTRFNFVDVILILIIIAAILSIYFIIRNRSVEIKGTDDKIPVSIQLQVSRMPAAFKNLTAIGDPVYHAETGQLIGTVRNVTYGAYTYEGYSHADHSTVATELDDFVTMTLMIDGYAVEKSGTYIVGGCRISIGDTMRFRVPDMTSSAECRAITMNYRG